MTATWTGEVPTQPAVAIELTEASGDRDDTDGRELDLTLRIQLGERLLAGAGYAHLAPGRVLRQGTPGGARRYPYLLVVADF